MIKLPRTLHIENSRMPPGKTDPEAIKFSQLAEKNLIIEEKVDGTGVGINFDSNANIVIQTRAKVASTKEFDLLHKWANNNMDYIWDALSDRYIMYGEWMYSKHTIYYDNLSSYFLESDIYDKQKDIWLSTKRRKEVLEDARRNNFSIASVPMLSDKQVSLEELKSLITTSKFKTDNWKGNLLSKCFINKYDIELVAEETDQSNDMEGLYIKHEVDDRVVGRFKYIRYGFLECILKSGSHIKDRVILPNDLAKENCFRF